MREQTLPLAENGVEGGAGQDPALSAHQIPGRAGTWEKGGRSAKQ